MPRRLRHGICPDLAGKLVAIDGKTLRGSRKAEKSTVQILIGWLGLETIVRIECHTMLPGGEVREDSRYSISSLEPAKHLAQSRSHWGIENSCHWVLAVVFREDEACARYGYAAQYPLHAVPDLTQPAQNQNCQAQGAHTRQTHLCALDLSYLEAILELSQM